MNIKAIKIAFVGLILSVSSFANAGLINLNATDGGWYQNTGNNNGTPANVFSGIQSNIDYRNWFSWDVSNILGTITSAKIEIWSSLSNSNNQQISWQMVSTSSSDLGNVSSVNIFNDLGTGTVFSTGIQNNGVLNTFILNNSAINYLNMNNNIFSIGGKNLTGGKAFGYGPGVGGSDTYRLVLNVTDVAQVPEPSTLVIFTLGIMGLMSRRFKKAN